MLWALSLFSVLLFAKQGAGPTVPSLHWKVRWFQWPDLFAHRVRRARSAGKPSKAYVQRIYVRRSHRCRTSELQIVSSEMKIKPLKQKRMAGGSVSVWRRLSMVKNECLQKSLCFFVSLQFLRKNNTFCPCGGLFSTAATLSLVEAVQFRAETIRKWPNRFSIQGNMCCVMCSQVSPESQVLGALAWVCVWGHRFSPKFRNHLH